MSRPQQLAAGTILVTALAGAPPHEAAAGAGTLAFASLVAEGHGDEAAADRLAEAAVRASDEAAPSPTLTLARVAGSAADTAVRARALTAATARLGAAESDRRSAAAGLAERARIEEAAAEPAFATESWRASLAAEPTYLPAARALRIAAARTGDSTATSGASETEAACLLVPAHRVRAMLLSAALALEATPPERERALGLLRAALVVDPAHDAAFERMRALLTELDDSPALAAALAARIEVAGNPFEVTSLRLARADLLAGKLGDWGAAREELEAVLRRQPEHARALERLSELLWSREAWGEAGEIYLRRAVVERDPATLREIFLRLGEILFEPRPRPQAGGGGVRTGPHRRRRKPGGAAGPVGPDGRRGGLEAGASHHRPAGRARARCGPPAQDPGSVGRDPDANGRSPALRRGAPPGGRRGPARSRRGRRAGAAARSGA